MSSSESPALRLEIETDWVLVSALLAWAAVLLVCLGRAELPWWVLLPAATLVAGAVGLGVRAQLPGSGRRTPAAITWAASGDWIVHFADGSESPAVLAPGSRLLPFGVLLAFDSVRGRRWLLLRAHARGRGELRRLRVRMRLAAERMPAEERRRVACGGS